MVTVVAEYINCFPLFRKLLERFFFLPAFFSAQTFGGPEMWQLIGLLEISTGRTTQECTGSAITQLTGPS